jgi:hypothetical protein
MIPDLHSYLLAMPGSHDTIRFASGIFTNTQCSWNRNSIGFQRMEKRWAQAEPEDLPLLSCGDTADACAARHWLQNHSSGHPKEK